MHQLVLIFANESSAEFTTKVNENNLLRWKMTMRLSTSAKVKCVLFM